MSSPTTTSTPMDIIEKQDTVSEIINKDDISSPTPKTVPQSPISVESPTMKRKSPITTYSPTVTTARQMTNQLLKQQQEKERMELALKENVHATPQGGASAGSIKKNDKKTPSAHSTGTASAKTSTIKNKGKSTPSTIVSNTTGSPTKRKSNGGSISKAKRMKMIADLEAEIVEKKMALEKSQRDKQKALIKYQQDVSNIKYPLIERELYACIKLIDTFNKDNKTLKKDLLYSNTASNRLTKLPSQLPAPSVVEMLPLSYCTYASTATGECDSNVKGLMDINNSVSITELLTTYNFFNLFSTQLGLSKFSIDEYADMICYQDSNVLLSEVLCCLLKVILDDPMVARIQKRMVMSAQGNSGGDNIHTILPKKLQPSLVTPLSCDALVTALLPHLQPVRKILKSFAGLDASTKEVSNIPSQSMPIGVDATPACKRSHAISNVYTEIKAISLTEEQKPSPGAKTGSSLVSLQNRDISMSVTENMVFLYKQIESLLHELTANAKSICQLEPSFKLTCLSILCETCYDVEYICKILTEHAEEYSNRLGVMKAQQEELKSVNKDPRFRLKEYSEQERKKSMFHCRLLNIEKQAIRNCQIQLESKQKALVKKKKAVNNGDIDEGVEESHDVQQEPAPMDIKKEMYALIRNIGGSNKPAGDASTDNVNSEVEKEMKSKQKKEKAKTDVYTPSAAQMVTFMDEMRILEKNGIDICVTSPVTLYLSKAEQIELCQLPDPYIDFDAGPPVATSSKKSKSRGSSSLSKEMDYEPYHHVDSYGLPLDEYPSDDEDDMLFDMVTKNEEDMMKYLDSKQKVKLRQKSVVRSKKLAEKNKIREGIEKEVEMRNEITNNIMRAIDNNSNISDKEMKNFIVNAKRYGLIDSVSSGRIYCANIIKRLYVYKQELIETALEEKKKYENQKILNKYFIRLDPLGLDRVGRKYYTFDNDDRLFVEERISKTDMNEMPESNRKLVFDDDFQEMEVDVCHENMSEFEKVQAHAIKKRNELKNVTTQALNRLIESKPASKCSKWYVYSTLSEIWKLYHALDDRGKNESKLKKNLKSVFDLFEEPLQFQSEGHEYIGRLIKHVFGSGRNKNVVLGLVTGYLPQEGSDPALWHVRHLVDTDEEDMELNEVNDVLVPEDEVEKLLNEYPDQRYMLFTVQQSLKDAAEANPADGDLSVGASTPLKAPLGAPVSASNAPIVATTTISTGDDLHRVLHEYKGVQGRAALGSVKALLSLERSIASDGAKVTASNASADVKLIDEEKMDVVSSASTNGANASDAEAELMFPNSKTGESSVRPRELSAPSFVDNYQNTMAGLYAIKKTQLGAEGFKNDLIRYNSMIIEGLKQFCGSASSANAVYGRENRKTFDATVRQATGLSDCKSLILQLETILHDGCQSSPDIEKDEEVAREKQLIKDEMLEEGWCFTQEQYDAQRSAEGDEKEACDATATNPMEYVNRRIRRYFPDYGVSDGMVQAYLPSNINDGLALYHIVYDDEDEEDLDVKGTTDSIVAYDDNYTLDQMKVLNGGSVDVGGSNPHSADIDGTEDHTNELDGAEEELDDDGEVDIYHRYSRAENSKAAEEHFTLWPTASARNAWIKSVLNSHSISELSIAFGVFIEYSRNFGCIGSDELNDQIVSISNSNAAAHNLGKRSYFPFNLNNNSKHHIWCVMHNKPIEDTIKEKNSKSKGNINAYSSANNQKRKHRKSVSNKIQNNMSSYGRSSSRRNGKTVSYIGMD